MASRIEDYAMIGDCMTAALVGRDGSIDWLCLPAFDSGACFAALLGTPEHGRWRIAPAGEARAVRRRYRGPSLILETETETDEGAVRVVDFMPPRTAEPDLIRIVEGVRGTVRMRMELIIRFDYGSIVPWVRRMDHTLWATAGPDQLRLHAPVEWEGQGLRTVAEFTVGAGQRIPFVLVYHPSHEPDPSPVDPDASLRDTEAFWAEWAGRCTYDGPHREHVLRSLVTLKGMTYAPTGGIVAAVTTSLPERIGGIRNWDYRFCWVRDATFTLFSLLSCGYLDEARAWREWLVRAVAGDPAKFQIMYGIDGRRRLTEQELPWLPGYEGSRPVRIGNQASEQFQLDVYGELFNAMYHSRHHGLEPHDDANRVGLALLEFLEAHWDHPDEGIWEIRGPRRCFTHSKVMAWVGFDRAVRWIEETGARGPVDRWRAVRDRLHAQICREGFDADRNTFVQSYGSKELDASLLTLPLVGFLPPGDPRIRGTVEAIEADLLREGLVERYRSTPDADGLPAGEGKFLACSFWLVDNYHLLGRAEDARRLFERLLGLCNDVGLLAEEYDPAAGRQVGNFPQAFSHISLVNTAVILNQARPHPARAMHEGQHVGADARGPA